MPIRNIVKEGDSCLKKKCRPVVDFNERLWSLLDDMHDTLKAANGAGLAAPQVGVLRCIALVMLEDESYLEIINPEIISREGTQTGVEGCLSVPGVWGIVERPEKVTVKAQDRFGKELRGHSQVRSRRLRGYKRRVALATFNSASRHVRPRHSDSFGH